jgi:Domain of unknown function (DUF4145)
MVEFHDNPESIYVAIDADGHWGVVKRSCPACRRIILHLQSGTPPPRQQGFPPLQFGEQFRGFQAVAVHSLIRPKGSSRPPCPLEVPRKLANDYLEGCLVLADSAKAAAALGRRCLQNVLREVAGVKPGNLADEIQQVIDSGKLPSDLSDSIDAVRNVGNFAAHPMKSQHSGEILDVEPGEAEWTFDVLEDIFDFYLCVLTSSRRKGMPSTRS